MLRVATRRSVASLRTLARTPTAAASSVPKTWGHPAEGSTFNPDYQTEFRPSQIAEGGNGWWASVDIPEGVRLRRVAVAEGSLVKFDSLADLEGAGWDIDDAVNYGIGHWKNPASIYFLNPGTAMNHADRTREHSVRYVHDEADVMELWTTKSIKAGEEMFNEYHNDFAPCPWYDTLQRERGNVPLSQLNEDIEKMYAKK